MSGICIVQCLSCGADVYVERGGTSPTFDIETHAEGNGLVMHGELYLLTPEQVEQMRETNGSGVKLYRLHAETCPGCPPGVAS